MFSLLSNVSFFMPGGYDMSTNLSTLVNLSADNWMGAGHHHHTHPLTGLSTSSPGGVTAQPPAYPASMWAPPPPPSCTTMSQYLRHHHQYLGAGTPSSSSSAVSVAEVTGGSSPGSPGTVGAGVSELPALSLGPPPHTSPLLPSSSTVVDALTTVTHPHSTWTLNPSTL